MPITAKAGSAIVAKKPKTQEKSVHNEKTNTVRETRGVLKHYQLE